MNRRAQMIADNGREAHELAPRVPLPRLTNAAPSEEADGVPAAYADIMQRMTPAAEEALQFLALSTDPIVVRPTGEAGDYQRG